MLPTISQALWTRSSQLLTCVCRPSILQWQQQHRTAVIVRRLFPPPIPPMGRKVNYLKRSALVYVFEENTMHRPRQKLKVILTEDVPKIGLKGEVVMVDKRIGRNKLIPGGMAVYASPENLKEFALAKQREKESKPEEARLTPMAVKTIEHLKRNKLVVSIRSAPEWDAITKDHIIHAFRHRLGTVVAEHALTLPDERITDYGTYSVNVTVNGIETVPVEVDVIPYVVKRRKKRKDDLPEDVEK